MRAIDRWIGDRPGRVDPVPAILPERPGALLSADDGGGPIDPQAWLRQQLFEHRIVLLSGSLDDRTTNEVGASLMTLDAIGDDPVHLQLETEGGTTGGALALMDIIDLCGVPVRATAVGMVAGPALGVLAVCDHRTMSPHGRLRLFEPPVEAAGNARQLEQLARDHVERWTAFCSRVAAACGQPEARVHEDASAGRFFGAQEALDYGLADEVASPGARVFRMPGRPVGFDPR